MSRKACRRRHYALVNPIRLAMEGAAIPSESRLDKLRLRELSAIEAFAKGNATPNDFRDLCDMLNLAETMANGGIGPEVLPVCEAVQAELLAAKDRYEAKGRMVLTAAGLTALRDLYEYHDLQRTSIALSEYEKAIKATRDRIRSAHPDVKVLT